MFGTLPEYLGAIGLLLFNLPVAAQSTGGKAEVTLQGFCLQKSAMKCEEVALPGMTVPIDQLPKLEDGTRVVYFFSDQDVSSNSVLVHVLEAEDFDHQADYVIPESMRAVVPDLQPALQAIVEKIGAVGGVTLMPFRSGAVSGKPSRVFSYMRVEGPGVYAGRVTDLNGALVPSSKRVSFTVSQDSSMKKSKPSRGGGAMDTDPEG